MLVGCGAVVGGTAVGGIAVGAGVAAGAHAANTIMADNNTLNTMDLRISPNIFFLLTFFLRNRSNTRGSWRAKRNHLLPAFVNAHARARNSYVWSESITSFPLSLCERMWDWPSMSEITAIRHFVSLAR
jgi:hypothetical protein